MNKKLIKQLSSELTPVDSLCKKKRFLFWLISIVLFLFGILTYFKFTTVCGEAMASSLFWGDVVLIVLAIILSTRASFSLCSPSKCYVKTLLFLVPVLFFLIAHSAFLKGLPECVSICCIERVLFFSIIPTVVMLFLCKGNYSTHPKWFLFFLLFSSGMVGTLLQHFLCPNRMDSHIMLSHFFPVVIVSVLLTFLLSPFLKKL